MQGKDRRQFLANVGRGMLLGSFGASLACDLEIATAAEAASLADDTDRLTFGALEPLVSIMQETPLPRLQSVLLDQMQGGADLETLVSAGALANARTFGGHDYVGFHTFMALTPALVMSQELDGDRKPLPILKVLYRNTERIQQFGGASNEVLRRLDESKHEGLRSSAEALQDATRKADFDGAEQIMASLASETPMATFQRIQYPVQDDVNVHRVVLAWRAWQAVDLVGDQHANSLLRQSVQFCLKASESRIRDGRPDPELWGLVPRLLDQYKLLGRSAGTKEGDDRWLEELSQSIFQSQRAEAADAAAQALAAGYATDQVAEAISIAANRLLLHDPGRSKDGDGDKVRGTVHGASVGVHASDAANAWRNIARVSNQRNAVTSILVGAYHTAGQSPHVAAERWPLKHDQAESVESAKSLLALAEDAIRNRDQALAAAAIERFGQLSGNPRDAFDLLLRFSTSEDGALHAEKYYHTVREEFASTRPSLRWRHLVGLARVSASEYGTTAPGYREACELLGVQA